MRFGHLPTAEPGSLHAGVPAAFALAVDWLDSWGIDEEGLYRIPGSTSKVAAWQAAVHGGGELPLTSRCALLLLLLLLLLAVLLLLVVLLSLLPLLSRRPHPRPRCR